MAEITINITGPLADVVEGDHLWVAHEDGTATERIVVGVEYATNSGGEWVVDYFKLSTAGVNEEDEPDDDDWDWFGPNSVFRTEKEAIEHKLEEVDREIADDVQELQAKRSIRHKLQRRLTVLTDGELFDNGD